LAIILGLIVLETNLGPTLFSQTGVYSIQELLS